MSSFSPGLALGASAGQGINATSQATLNRRRGNAVDQFTAANGGMPALAVQRNGWWFNDGPDITDTVA